MPIVNPYGKEASDPASEGILYYDAERQAQVGPALMGRSRMGSGDTEEALPCKGIEPPSCGGDGCRSCHHQRGPSHLLLLLSVFLLQVRGGDSGGKDYSYRVEAWNL